MKNKRIKPWAMWLTGWLVGVETGFLLFAELSSPLKVLLSALLLVAIISTVRLAHLERHILE